MQKTPALFEVNDLPSAALLRAATVHDGSGQRAQTIHRDSGDRGARGCGPGKHRTGDLPGSDSRNAAAAGSAFGLLRPAAVPTAQGNRAIGAPSVRDFVLSRTGPH